MAKKNSKNEEKKKKVIPWNVSSRHSSFWMKFYAEQCGYPRNLPVQDYYDQLKQFDTVLPSALTALQSKYDIDFRVHYLDEVEVDKSPFLTAAEKPHCHAYFKIKNAQNIRFSTFLNDLRSVGITLDGGEDLELLKHVIEDGNGFPNEQRVGQGESYCIVYGSHQTPIAELEGKHTYDWNDPHHFTTYTEDDFKRFLLEQSRLNDHSKASTVRVLSLSETRQLAVEARALGEAGGDFDTWWFDELPIESRLGVSDLSKIMREYDYGITHYLSDPMHTDMTRVCLYVEGPRNVGKSGSLARALSELGYPTYIVSQGGGTGKMDEFKYSHKALVLDDTSVKGFFSYADDKICRAYKRNSGNPLFACTYLAVTSNKDIATYYSRVCGHNLEANQGGRWIAELDEEFLAFKSRFVCIKVNDNGEIVSIDHHLRGDSNRVLEKVNLLEKLLPFYSRYMSEYRQKKASGDSLTDIDQRLNAFVIGKEI